MLGVVFCHSGLFCTSDGLREGKAIPNLPGFIALIF
jgi:hypothetical protein